MADDDNVVEKETNGCPDIVLQTTDLNVSRGKKKKNDGSGSSRNVMAKKKIVKRVSNSVAKGKGGSIVDSDDDFQTPYPKKQKVNQTGKSKKIVEGSKIRKDNPFRTRTSPKPLFEAIKKLNNPQKDCVKEMGFEHLLHMTVDGIPSRLGLYVVDNLNTQTLFVSLKNSYIRITKEVVRDLIGVPMGEKNLISLKHNVNAKVLIEEWKAQYTKKNIRTQDVLKQITVATEADWLFKWNFIVLFCNTMCMCKTSGILNLDFLHYIDRDTQFSEIDWCSYMLICLEESKASWKRFGPQCFYSGPLCLLALAYVDNVRFDGFKMKRISPVIRCWSMESLRQRVKKEINSLGRLGIADVFVEGEEKDYNVEESEKQSVHDKADSSSINVDECILKLECLLTNVVNANELLKRDMDEAFQKFPHSEELFELKAKVLEFLKSCTTSFQGDQELAAHDKFTLCVDEGIEERPSDQAVEKGSNRFGNLGDGVGAFVSELNVESKDETIADVVKAAGMETFTQEEASLGTKKGCEESIEDLIRVSFEIFPVTQVNTVIADGNEENSKHEGSSVHDRIGEYGNEIQDIEFDEFTDEEVDVALKTVEKVMFAKKSLIINQSQPSFSLGIDLSDTPEACEKGGSQKDEGTSKLCVRDDELGNVGGIKVVEEVKEKRVIIPSQNMCSPYINRKVNIKEKLSSIEVKLAEWIFSFQGDPWDKIYTTTNDELGARGFFETLAPSCCLYSNVIDMWCTILNHEEGLRDRGSVFRVYCDCSRMSEIMLDPEQDDEQKFHVFRGHLHAAIQHKEELFDLREVDMVFVPMQKLGHFYLYIFNLRNPAYIILDNTFEPGTDLIQKYGDLPHVLKKMMVRHLEYEGHPKLKNMRRCLPNAWSLKWRSTQNGVDSGIFTMRHMESYKGEKIKDFDSGFLGESPAQQSQLNLLRSKYLGKILLSDMNNLKSFVIKEAEKFHKIPEAERKKLLQIAVKKKDERFQSFIV